MLESECSDDDQCTKFTNNTVCHQLTSATSVCKCKEGFQSLILTDYMVCVQVDKPTFSVLYPSSLASIFILIIILAFLLFFVIRLFNNTQCQHRPPCADAALTPIIKLDGKDLIVTESSDDLLSTSSPVSDSRTYSPGPVLTPEELRKMSLLSSLSVTIPLDQDFSVRAVSPTGCRLSPEHIIPPQASSPGHVEHVEQSVTIIPNLRAVNKRRKSMANYAFPELHPEAQLHEPSKNLLIYTRTGVDSCGRRHSVSIPLLPRSSHSKSDTPLVTIQRKGQSVSHSSRRNSSRNMESISETRSRLSSRCEVSQDQETSMDCLTVPGAGQQPQRKSKRMSVRQNSLPARPSRGTSPTSASRSHSSLRGGSFHKPRKQDLYHFLDSAIAH